MPLSPRTLRPSSAFTPKSISGLALWLDASQTGDLYQNSDGTVPAVNAGDPVGYWRDRSGNGRHVVAATGAARPTVGAVNSRAAVNFDGTDDTLAYLQGLTSNDLTTFCVYRCDTLNGGIVFDYGYSSDNTNASSTASTGFGNAIGVQASSVGVVVTRLDTVRSFVGESVGLSTGAGAITAGATAIHTAACSFGATSTRYAAHLGASLSGTSRFNGTQFSLLSLGSRRAGASPASASVFHDGQICEFLMYERNLPQSQRRRIEQYLASRWGITLAPQVSNADAQDWINRVYANGGTVSSGTASAVNSLCDSLDASGVRPLIYRMGIFAGTGLNAALVPLYRGPSLGGTQYGNTTDTNVGPFVSGDYVETGASGGLLGNGTSKYLNTGLAPSALPSVATGHMAAYVPQITPSDATKAFMGNASGSNQYNLSYRLNSATGLAQIRTVWGATASNDASEPSSVLRGGLRLATRTGSTALRTYHNSTQVSLHETSVTPASHVNNWFVFAFNSAGTPIQYSPDSMRAYSIGESMSAEQVAAYYTAMQAFQTALGRNV